MEEEAELNYFMDLRKTTQQFLLNLRLISNIPKHGQLDTTGGEVTIFQWSIWNIFQRTLSRDDRNKTVNTLKTIYNEVNIFTDKIIKVLNNKEEMIEILISFAERISESLNGIRNLKDRYKYDHTITVKLQHIESDIVIPNLMRILKKIPEKYMSESILKGINKSIFDSNVVPNVESNVVPNVESNVVPNVESNVVPRKSHEEVIDLKKNKKIKK